MKEYPESKLTALNEIDSVEHFAESHKTKNIEPLYRGASKSSKTEIWAIKSTHNGDELGEVSWFGRWRQYTFFPLSDRVFSHDCLQDIATICRVLTMRQRLAYKT